MHINSQPFPPSSFFNHISGVLIQQVHRSGDVGLEKPVFSHASSFRIQMILGENVFSFILSVQIKRWANLNPGWKDWLLKKSNLECTLDWEIYPERYVSRSITSWNNQFSQTTREIDTLILIKLPECECWNHQIPWWSFIFQRKHWNSLRSSFGFFAKPACTL